jgi:solute carrier family 25 protein 14/30
MIHTFIKVYKEEGLIALYNGLSPALLRQASYGTIKIGLYHLFKNQLTNYTNQQDEVFHMNIIAGVSSGAVAAAIANPTDVLKVRLQAATSFHYKQNIVRAFMTIYNTEGLRGLYRGVGPTSQRAGLVAGVLLPSYDLFKKIIIQSGALGDDFITHLIASFLAGVAGAVVTNPIDVIKSRMMNQSISSSHYYYSSSFDCFIKSIKSEGLMSLYRGFIPSYLRLGPWNIIVS